MQTFGKQERLCSEKLMDDLFRTGHRMMVFPFSIHWKLCPKEMLPANVPAQVLIATSKKKFHHAIDRNHVKRLTRECYRLHKPELYELLEERQVGLLLAVNYVHNDFLDFWVLYHKFDKITSALLHGITAETMDPNSATSHCPALD